MFKDHHTGLSLTSPAAHRYVSVNNPHSTPSESTIKRHARKLGAEYLSGSAVGVLTNTVSKAIAILVDKFDWRGADGRPGPCQIGADTLSTRELVEARSLGGGKHELIGFALLSVPAKTRQRRNMSLRRTRTCSKCSRTRKEPPCTLPSS